MGALVTAAAARLLILMQVHNYVFSA